jgi:NAD(P)-dependent dehydrogenase (short-subunit alcohol dehydrogenase family)
VVDRGAYATLLTGKVAIVTGAASGNGRAIALAFAESGASAVVLADVISEPREGGTPTTDLLAELGVTHKFVQCDVGDEADMDALVDAADEFGGVDIMVNNAGITGKAGSILDLPSEEFDRIIRINLRGAYLGTRAAARKMVAKGGGSIINISSTAGLQGSVASPGYSASKGGVRLLTYAAAGDTKLAHNGVRVNTIHPGIIKTAMTLIDRPLAQGADHHPMLAAIPVGRLGEPSDIADACLYLASDLSSYVTGQSIVVDGGWTSVLSGAGRGERYDDR